MNPEKSSPSADENAPQRRPASPWNILWLCIAFVPAVIFLMSGNDLMPDKRFWILNGIFSILAGLGVCRALFHKRIARGIAGVLIGVGFFVMTSGLLLALNLMIVFYKGCCSGSGNI